MPARAVIRYLPSLLAATALVAGIWWIVGLVRDRAELAGALEVARIEIATQSAALAQAQEAARVHRAYLARLEADRARWSAIDADLQSMEGRDAPLSDLLRAAAGRLYGP